MKSSIEIMLSCVFLVAYCYTIIKAHALLSAVNKIVPVPKNADGKVSLSLIKAWNTAELKAKSPDIKTSILLLTLNNYIVFAYFAFLIGALFFEAASPVHAGITLANLNHH